MRYLILIFITFTPYFLFCQNGMDNSLLTEDEREELILLVKDLYELEVGIALNITSNDLKSNFDDMSEGKKYNAQYLNDLLKKVGDDSLNPLNHYNLAEYYSNIKNVTLAINIIRKR